MGSAISAIQSSVGVKDDKEIQDNLDLIQEITKQKKESFKAMLEASRSNIIEIPIDRILNSYSHSYCKIDQKSDQFSTEIGNTLKAFVHGDILSGITSVMSMGITSILGNTSAGATLDTQYLIFVGKHGSFQRMDYELYRYNFTSDKVIAATQSVLLVTYAISSADIKTIDENTLTAVLDDKYGDLPDAEFTKIRDAVMRLKKEE